MKNKKLLKALAALTLSSAAAAGCVSLIGCAHKHEYSDTYTYDETYHWYGATCEHTDEVDGKEEHTFGADDKCTYCGYQKPAPHEHTYATQWTKTETEHWYAATCEHKDEKKDKASHNFDDDGVCSVCQYEKETNKPDDGDDDDGNGGGGGSEETTTYKVTFDIDGHGTQPQDQTIEEGKKATDPGALTAEGWIFKGWYKDAAHSEPFDFDTETITGTTTIYAWWVEDEEQGEDPEPTYEWVNGTTINFKDSIIVGHTSSNKTTAEVAFGGKFKLGTGVYVDANSNFNELGDVNTQKVTKALYITLYGVEGKNTITFKSRGTGNINIYRVVEGGTDKLVATIASGTGDWTGTIGYDKATGTTQNLVEGETLTAGTYYIGSDTSGRLGNFSIDEYVEQVKPNGISVSGAVSNFIVGQEFSDKDLSVTLDYPNGRKDGVNAGYQVNYDSYQKDQAGKYTITVSYKPEGAEQPFAAYYDVYVYNIDSVEVGGNKIVKGNNSSFNNGVYENHKLKQLYYVNDELDLDGLTLILSASIASEQKNTTFRIDGAEVTPDMVSGYDKTQVGYQTVTVTAYGHSDTFEVFVANKPADISTVNEVTAYVDQDTEAEAIATLANGKYAFKTIQQALEFLADAKADATKTLEIAPGTYTEKLEITIPKLTMIGVGTGEVKIEYDSLYGVEDESGFIHTTDSTQTIAVREAATGFTIKNITVSNAYNSQAAFEGTGLSSGERGLAMLIQADQVTIDNCKLLGYQDTLELFTGRQLVINSYISGTTDFIFGSNNTTYFYNCEIRSIATLDNVKTDGAKGGYVTAFKGVNQEKGNVNKAITYGTIFDNCDFTADEGVVDGVEAIGRTWGANATVLVMNSRLGAHISKGTGTDRSNRYVAMNANPTLETVKFREYNNTGAGAIDETWAGITSKIAEIATQALAEEYADLTKVFGVKDGDVTWDAAWEVSLSIESVIEKALSELAAYRAADIAELDETEDATVIAEIAVIKQGATISAAETAAEVKAALAQAKAEIDAKILSTKSPEELRQEAYDSLEAYANKKLESYDEEADAELYTSVETALAGYETAVATVEVENLDTWLTEAKEAIDDIVAEYAAAHTTENGSEEYNTYKAQFGENVVVSSTFETEGQLTNFSGTYGTAGIYQDTNMSPKDFTGNNVTVNSDKKAELIDTTDKATNMVVDFGTVKEVVEGYFEMTFKDQGNSWTPVQFIGSGNKEVIGFRTDGGKIKYRLDGGNVVAGSVDSANNTVYKVYFKFNLLSGKVTIKIGTVDLVTEATAGIDIKNIVGVKFVSSDNGSKTMFVDNVIVASYDLELADYKTAINGMLTAEKTKYAALCSTNVDDINTAYTTATSAITNATTKEAVKEAYDNAITAFEAVETDEQVALKAAKDAAIEELDGVADNYTTEGEDGNKSAFDALYAQALLDINAAETPEAVEAVMVTVRTELAKILTDEDLDKPRYWVTFMDGDTEIDSYEAVENSAIAEPAKLTAANSVFVGWCTDAELTTLYNFDNATTNKVTAPTTLYAKWNGTVDIIGTVEKKYQYSSSLTTTTPMTNKVGYQQDGIFDFLFDSVGNNAFCVGGETKDSNNRYFKIDLSKIANDVDVDITINFAVKKSNSVHLATENKGTPDAANIIKTMTQNDSSDYTAHDLEATVKGGQVYYFCNAGSNCRLYSITVSYTGVTGQQELTAINGSVTLKEDGSADLTNVTFSVKGSETSVTAASLGNKVTAVVSEDQAYVTVSCGKLTKKFDIAA